MNECRNCKFGCAFAVDNFGNGKCGCKCHTASNKPDWKEEWLTKAPMEGWCADAASILEIKDFITSLLSKQREELREKIEKMISTQTLTKEMIVRNSALKDVLSLLSINEKEEPCRECKNWHDHIQQYTSGKECTCSCHTK